MSQPQNEENTISPSEEQRADIGRKSGSTNDEPQIQARSGGRGEVRSESDRRLRDNLTREQRSEIGRKGGESVSRNRAHMAEIGRKGGQAVSQNREHMAAIGREGGRA